MLDLNHKKMADMMKLEELYTKFCSDEQALIQELIEEFGAEEAASVKEELENGVDGFYELYKSEMTGEELRDRLADNMKDMDNLKKFHYLSNLLCALNAANGEALDTSEQADMMGENEIISAAIENGMLDSDSSVLQEAISKMQDLIESDVEHFAVLFAGTPPYETLLDACKEGDAEEVKALAANTRQSAVNMAGAMTILNHRGVSAFAEKDSIHPRDMGVVAASSLEMDAVQKQGDCEESTTLIQKIARTACTLLVASPNIIKDAAALTLVAVLTNFSSLWLLISGAILVINIRVHMNNLKKHMEPIFNTGARILNSTLGAAKKTALHIADWIQTTVIPAAIPVWEKVREFTEKHILIPAARFVMKAKSVAVSIRDKASGLWNRLKEKISGGMENIIDRARETSDGQSNSGEQGVSGQADADEEAMFDAY